jgi:4-amino-4-deoxy-L-arabinose transferase-like glycosyltransferase
MDTSSGHYCNSERNVFQRWKLSDGMIALLLFLAATLALTVTAKDIGLTWDEPVYINSGQSYARWVYILVKDPLRALQAQTIDTYWTITHEHPPVERLWSGLVWLAARHFFDDITANRLGAILLAGLLVALVYLLIAGMYNRASGLFASAALLCMPRFFFHSHLAALDVPVAMTSFALIFLFWKTVNRKGWVWGIPWGIAWGVALATKLNGIFIPFAVVAWILVFRRTWVMAIRLFLMGIVAALTFFILWPWLYFQPWKRALEYLYFHLGHHPIGQWYLGQYYLPPPWHYVFVILWAVVPLTLMALFLLGVSRCGNGKRDNGLVWLLIFSAIASISPFIFGINLAYNGERLFMPVFPYIACLAGIGFGWLVACTQKLLKKAKKPALSALTAWIMGIALLLPPIISMAGLYPHLLSYYSAGVGGLPGATKLGLETTYWNETYASAIPYLNAHSKTGDKIWVENQDVFRYYQSTGLIRPDVNFITNKPAAYHGQKGSGGFWDANWYVFQYLQTQFGAGGEANYVPLQVLKTQTPVFVLQYERVPLMAVYGAITTK